MSGNLQRLGRAIAPFSILLGITIVLLWKISLTGQYTWLNSPDISRVVVPWVQFQAGRWQAGHFPLWDPYHWGGQPFPGQLQPGAMYPLNWILFLLPFKDGHVSYRLLHWYLVLIHFMAASFAYLLCRDLRRSRSASILGGIAFAFSGFVGAADWPQMINGAVWLPLVLLFALRSLRGQRPLASGAFCGASLGIALLGGHHQVPLFTALLVAGLGIYALVTRPAQRRQLAQATAAFAVFALLCGGAQTLPAREYGQVALRWVNAANPVGWQDRVPYTVHDAYSLVPVGALGLVIPGVHPVGYFDPYVGLTVLLLAVAAAALFWNDATVRILAAAALCALVFSFGSASAFHGVLYAVVPALNKARAPSAAVVVFQVVVAALASYGLDALRDQRDGSRNVWKRLTGFAVGMAAILWTTLFTTEFFQGDKVYSKSRTATAAFAALMLATLFVAARRSTLSRRALAVFAIAVMMFEFSAIVGYSYASREAGWPMVDQLTANQDIIRFIQAQPRPFRVGMDRALIPFNLGDWESIEQFDGYCGVTRDIVQLNGLPQTHMLFGERYWIGQKPQSTNQELVFSGASGLNVYRNPDAFPRVWSAHGAAVFHSDAELWARVNRPLDELRASVVVPAAPLPGVESCGAADEVRLTGYEDTRVTIDTHMACGGFVVLADTYAPGWRATIDGQRTGIYRAYGAARAVLVKAGTHRVRFEYSSTAVWMGSAMTVLGLLLLPVAVLVDSRIDPAEEPPAGRL